MKAIRALAIVLMSILLLGAALFAGRGIVMMISDVQNGVEVEYTYNPRQRVREDLVKEQQEKIREYIAQKRDVLIDAASADFPEEAAVAKLNDAGEAYFYDMYGAMLWPVYPDAVRTVLQDGIVVEIWPGEIMAFETHGSGSVLSSVEIGFYYSPEDVPLWASILPGAKTPAFDRDGDGWWLNTDALDEQVKNVVYYEYYTERICENFFYFEMNDA